MQVATTLPPREPTDRVTAVGLGERVPGRTVAVGDADVDWLGLGLDECVADGFWL